jgi:hypothetical protein
MSGGHFNYAQHRIGDIIKGIEEALKPGLEISEKTRSEFRTAIIALRIAQIYTQRIDWFLSGDDGEENFHRRLAEEINALDEV